MLQSSTSETSVNQPVNSSLRQSARQRLYNVLQSVLNPPLLQQVDRILLLNYPEIWTMKLHRLIYMTLPLWIIVFLGSMATPISQPYQLNGHLESYTWLLSILAIAVLAMWFYGQDFFHLEKEHGTQRDRSGWREFGMILFALLFVLMTIPTFLLATRQRIVMNVDRAQLATHMVLIDLVSTAEIYDESYSEYETRIQAIGEFIALGPSVKSVVNTHLINRDSSYRTFYSNGIYRPKVEFIQSYYDPEIARPVGLAWQINDSQPLQQLLDHYGSVSSTDGGTSVDYTGRSYVSLRLRANRAISSLFNLGFGTEFSYRINAAFLTMFAVAIHLTLFRFLFKYAGRKGIWRTLGVLFALLMLTWFSMGLMYPARTFFNTWGGASFSRFEDNYWAVLLTLLVVWIGFTAQRTREIPLIQQFTWRHALSAYLLPFLAIMFAYAVPWIINSQVTVGTGNSGIIQHYFFNSREVAHSWPLYSLGYILVYTMQFAYLPLIPYLKRQYTRLLVLPRRV